MKIEFKESERVEFKESLADIDDIVEHVCAFAMKKGGKILIGVKNDGTIVGVMIGRQTLEQLTNKIVDNTDPPIYPKIEVKRMESKDVIAIGIGEGTDKPYTAFGRPFIRVGKVKKQMKRGEYERLLFERRGISLDSQICKEATLKEIDWKKAKWFKSVFKALTRREILAADKKLLENLGCIKDGKITNAGILLFGKKPEKFISQNRITVVRYPGNSVSDRYLEIKDFYGNLFDLIDNADAYIKEHIQVASKLVPGRIPREDIPQYPLFAIRELIVNAVAHRDYFIAGSRIIVKVFSDRMEYHSPGSFPQGITPKNILDRQHSRNKIIVKVLNKIKYIEEIGDGINRVFDEIKQHPLKPKLPLFKDVDGLVIATLYSADMGKLERMELKEKLSEREIKIIDLIKEKGRITSKDIQEMFNISRDSANRYLNKLIKQSLIVRKGIGKATYYTAK